MACVSDESWVPLPKMLFDRLSLPEDDCRDDDKEPGFFRSESTAYRLEKVFPVYTLGILKPESDPGGLASCLGDPIWDAVREEAKLEAFKDRDLACLSYCSALLYLKGYHSLQVHRVAHSLWNQGRKVLALALQSRVSEVFGVDIHPAAKIGEGILLDHGTGVVIGETAVAGNRVSLMHGVTLGGTGKEIGDRHQKVGDGALIGASVTVLGNIKIGQGAIIAVGSLVLEDVPPHSMVAGIPAKVIRYADEIDLSLTMKHDATKDFFENVAVRCRYTRPAGWCGR